MKKILLFVCALICSAAMSAKTIYFAAGEWDTSGAKFALYHWADGVDGAFVSEFMAKDEASGYFTAEVPDASTNIILVRMTDKATAPGWEPMWNQTVDLTPGDNNLFTFTSWGDETSKYSTGTWSVYTPGDEPQDPVIALAGDMNEWSTTECLFVLSDDKATATASATLEAGKTYGFKILVDGKWYSNDYSGTMTEINCTDWPFIEKDGYDTETKITTVKEGSYKFTWNVEKKTLSVTYPSVETSISFAEAEVVTTKVIRNGQVLIIRDGVVYNMMGQAIR